MKDLLEGLTNKVLGLISDLLYRGADVIDDFWEEGEDDEF